GTQWIMSLDGLNYVNATGDEVPPGTGAVYSPFGPDGYPAIDQVTGKVFQAAGCKTSNGCTSNGIYLNIGTPDATGTLHFLDATGTGQRRVDGNRRCSQRLSLDQGGGTGTRRCGLVRIGQERGSEQPVGPEVERLHVPGGLSDQRDRWADRGGAVHAPRQGHSASDALQRHLPAGNGMHRVAGKPQPGGLLRDHHRCPRSRRDRV